MGVFWYCAYYSVVSLLRAGYLALALKIQEAADALTSSDVRARLSDAIQDAHRGTGTWAYYIDHTGDGESGDVIYSCDGDVFRAPYEISGGEGTAAKCVIDTEKAEDVVPRTIYEPEQDEADHYAAMESKRLYSKGPAPLCERTISKSEREKAPSGSFAGKGKSFPILKAGDVAAAASSIGRAGSDNYSTDVIKKNIIRIAKAKGWESELPKAWQDSDAKESATAPAAGLQLVESAATLEAIHLVEARSDYEIKLIAPGAGSSAFYPEEVLKRDGPKVFKKGTHVYLNHATAAEEAQRPEGDVNNLAGVLTTDAVYHESHAKGPGLYGRMKVFADHAQTVEEKAPHVGMSIRASGVAESGTRKNGLPVLKEFTSAESVDVVTRAGAGGMILTEAARSANPTQEASMDAEELKVLRETVAATTARTNALLEKEMRREAITESARVLRDVAMRPESKEYVIQTVVERGVPKTADGKLDVAKLTEAINDEAKRFAAALGQTQRVTGMGQAAGPQLTEADKTRLAESEKAEAAQVTEAWSSIFGGNVALAEVAMKGRAN